jgi:hypothetical protein
MWLPAESSGLNDMWSHFDKASERPIPLRSLRLDLVRRITRPNQILGIAVVSLPLEVICKLVSNAERLIFSRRDHSWQALESPPESYMIFRLISDRHSCATRQRWRPGKT